jgi:hypothetical protein
VRRVGGALEQLFALGIDADLQALFLDRGHVITMAVHAAVVNTTFVVSASAVKARHYSRFRTSMI